MKLTDSEAKLLLDRFLGEPFTTKGLSHQEVLDMLQHYIDNNKIYEMPDLVEWARAFSEVGEVANFDSKKAG